MKRLFGKNKSTKLEAARPVITLVVLALAGILLFAGGVSVEADDTGMTIKGFMFGETVSFDDITSIELRENFDKGSRSFGLGGVKISSGTFKNEEFGLYRLCVYNNVKSYIIISCGQKTIVFNVKTAEETKELYDYVASRLVR